jgi:hypothetical protein
VPVDFELLDAELAGFSAGFGEGVCEAEDRARWRKLCTPTPEQEAAAARKWAKHDRRWNTPFRRKAETIVSDEVTGAERMPMLAGIAGQLLRADIDSQLALELMRLWNARHCDPPLSLSEVTQTLDLIASRELARRRAAA